LSLILDAVKKGEVFDPLFTYGKGEGDESGEVEILETSEGEEATSGLVADVPLLLLLKLPLLKQSVRVAPPEIPPGDIANTEVISTEAAAAKAFPAGLAAEVATTEGTLTETAPGGMISTEVTTTVTSAPAGDDRNTSFSDHFSYIVTDLNDFAETPALNAPTVGSSQEEAVVPSVLDPVGLDYLYQNIIQHQASSVAELSMTVGQSLLPLQCRFWNRLSPVLSRSRSFLLLQLLPQLPWQ